MWWGESIRGVHLPKRVVARKPLSQQLSRGLAIDATMLRTVMSRLHDCEAGVGVPMGSIVYSLNELFPELLDPCALKMAERAHKCTELAQCASSVCECASLVCCACNAVAMQLVGSIRGNVQCACVASERSVWLKVQDALESLPAVAERIGANWRLARPPAPPPLPRQFEKAIPATADLFGFAPVRLPRQFETTTPPAQKRSIHVNPKWTVGAPLPVDDLTNHITEAMLRAAFHGKRSATLAEIVVRVRCASRSLRANDNLLAAVECALKRFNFLPEKGSVWKLPAAPKKEVWVGRGDEMWVGRRSERIKQSPK
jgi:hypothetical protein